MESPSLLLKHLQFLKHAPKQMHSSVQGSKALQYLHGGQQDFLQLYLTSSLHDLDTFGRVVQIRMHHSSSFLFHPHETGLGTLCCGIKCSVPNVYSLIYYPFCMLDECILCWGNVSICLSLANNFSLASFTDLHSIVLLQRITSSLSTSPIAKLKRSGQFANY